MFKPIPDKTTRLELNPNWCGDEYCCCFYLRITAYHNDKFLAELWDSTWVSEPDKQEVEDLREETKEACEFYQIDVDLSKDRWDWEAERLI